MIAKRTSWRKECNCFLNEGIESIICWEWVIAFAISPQFLHFNLNGFINWFLSSPFFSGVKRKRRKELRDEWNHSSKHSMKFNFNYEWTKADALSEWLIKMNWNMRQQAAMNWFIEWNEIKQWNGLRSWPRQALFTHCIPFIRSLPLAR